MKSLKEFIPLWKLIKEEKVKLIVASSLILIAGIAEIATGYLNGAAVESITNMALKNAVIYLLIYLGIELLSHAIIENYAGAMLEKIESKLTRKLGYYTYEKALNMPSYAYEEKTSGEVINRITTDADSLSFSFGHLLSAVSSLIGSLVVIIYIFINSWIVGLEIVIFVLLLFLIIRKYNPILKQAHKERKEKQDNFTSLVTESIRGIREIKTLGIKNSLLKDMTDIIKSIFQKSKNEIDVRKGFTLQTRILKGFLEVGVFITCVILIYYKQISLTFFISMTYYVYRYMWLIENFNNLTQTYQKLVVSLGRVNEILENRLYEDEKYGEKEISKTKGIIEFKDVTFGYPNEQITLNKFNLVLEPNKKIAIVGKSGQGKSTLFNLITRIFDPIEGQILLDGVNIKDLTEISLRKNISIIRQEPFIFNRTIKENFKLIDSRIPLATIRKYTKMAYLDDYIMSLPKKYDTVLGESGVNLSGGQKQRLSIARTLAKESKVILFDEATSALDNQSQEYIKQAIDNLTKSHTVVIVAHRLSTIMDADVIHIVDQGKIVASGTHDELLKTNEIYKNLYETESLNS
ncbi:MAG: ABC transporter ATP-binding protein [Bacilli bacterium]|nr:ABC transporter ATP-binding protein [Bacilli bacterium]